MVRAESESERLAFVPRARAPKDVSSSGRSFEGGHARAQLRNTGIPCPSDPEALPATHLDRQQAPGAEPQLCACGRGTTHDQHAHHITTTPHQGRYLRGSPPSGRGAPENA